MRAQAGKWLRTVLPLIRSEAEARPLTSWMRVFRAKVTTCRVRNLQQLADTVRAGPYNCVGCSHSYNGVQLVPGATAIILGESDLRTLAYDETSQTVRVGASVTIEELKRFLLGHDRRMLNSGNYMKQTVIGALSTGTHGYGPSPVMAEAVEGLKFMDGAGRIAERSRGAKDFDYLALSFGVIAPIVEVELRTAPLETFRSDAWITSLSQRTRLTADALAASYAVLPYSSTDDPTIMLHTLRAPTADDQTTIVHEPIWSFRRLAEFIIRRYWLFDRLFPFLRRPLQRFAASLRPRFHRSVVTDRRDLDYLYDPTPMLASERPPDILQGLFATTHTSYNLAFFVPLDDAPQVVRFIMNEADKLRDIGFYLKSLIGVRELQGTCNLPFAATFEGPVAAIDLFSDPRDYAWLERIQREVLAYYPDARPHWGKSAIVEEWRASLGEDHLRALLRLHKRHYSQRNLMLNEAVRRLLRVGAPLPTTSLGRAKVQSLTALSTPGSITPQP